jgi:hypothetical protein
MIAYSLVANIFNREVYIQVEKQMSMQTWVAASGRPGGRQPGGQRWVRPRRFSFLSLRFSCFSSFSSFFSSFA